MEIRRRSGSLGLFVGTWMEPQGRRLMEECADKDIIDKDDYPQTAEIEERCLCILADLWHAPDPDRAAGTSTTGSSEDCMLGGLVSDPRGQLPVFAVERDPAVSRWDVFHRSDRLREWGWLVHAYTLPADCQQMAVLRFVVRAGFTCDMADALLDDIERAVNWFQSLDGPMPSPQERQASFHH